MIEYLDMHLLDLFQNALAARPSEIGVAVECERRPSPPEGVRRRGGDGSGDAGGRRARFLLIEGQQVCRPRAAAVAGGGRALRRRVSDRERARTGHHRHGVVSAQPHRPAAVRRSRGDVPVDARDRRGAAGSRAVCVQRSRTRPRYRGVARDPGGRSARTS